MEKNFAPKPMPKSRRRFVSGVFYILLAVAVFFLFLAAGILPLRPVGTALETWQIHTGEGGWQEVRLPFIETIRPERQILELRASFPAVDADTLVIPRQSGNTIEVRLNGRLIYTLGDFAQPTANLWNYVHLVRLPEPLQEDNLLEIRIISVYYASGLNSVPYLCRYEECAGRVALLNWLYSDAQHAIAGAALITGAILVAMAFIRRRMTTPEFFIGWGLLLGVFYLLDFPFRLTTGSVSTFLWVKKGFLVSGYLASVGLLCGIELQYWQRIRLGRWAAMAALVIALALCASPDTYSLAAVQNYANVGLLVSMTVVVGMIVRSRQRPSWLLFPATLLSLSILLLLITLPLGITWPLMTPPIFIISTIMVGFQLILEYNQLFGENMRLQRVANLDPLTGALNRNVLSEVRAALHDYVVMIDLDGFKAVNDRFGHAFGDQVLIEFTRAVRQNLRQNDLVIRFGGDEFVLVLNGLSKTERGLSEVTGILERIRKEYAALHTEIPLSFSYGIAAVEGDDIQEAIEAADGQMYRMKQSAGREG